MAKSKKSTFQKAGKSVKILGVGLNSTPKDLLLDEISRRLDAGKKTLIVTPNPEFLVYAQSRPWFKKILNEATVAIPDGIGLIWASRILDQPLRGRVAGADLASELLALADKGYWRVGVVGGRRGDRQERERLIKRLQEKYPGAKIAALEDTPTWEKQRWEIIFACQGMGEQEKWIEENFSKIDALIFLGAGGSLDFLTGFAKRAPVWIRSIGFEWFYRLIRQPWRLTRQLALGKFIWLVVKEKISGVSDDK